MKNKTIGIILGEKKKEDNIVALDIDNYPKQKIIQEIKRLQKKYKLGNAILTKSSPQKHHIFFFWNMMSWDKSVKIMKDCRLVDEDWKEFKEKAKFTRIRVGIKDGYKPKIIQTIKSPHHKPNDLGNFYHINYKHSLKIF